MKKLIALLLCICLAAGFGIGATAEPQVDDDLLAILTEIRDNYHPGTAGCSLTAARLAAQAMDRYKSINNHAIAAATAAALDAAPEDPDGITFPEKLTDIFTSAISLYGESGLMLLSDSGYAPLAYPYEMCDVNAFFSGLFSGLQKPMPGYARIFIPNDTAEYLIAIAYPTDEIAPNNLIAALIGMGVLAEDVAANSLEITNEMLYLDMNAAFFREMCSMGTAGEFMLISALTETFMDNFGADRILVTVDGNRFETGHTEYDVIGRIRPEE